VSEDLELTPTVGNVAEPSLRHRVILDELEDATLVVDESFGLIYSNYRARGSLGIADTATGPSTDEAPAELTSDALLGAIHPDDVETALLGFAEVCAEPLMRLSIKLRVRHAETPTGWRHVEVFATNHLATPGVRGVVLAFRDIQQAAETSLALSNAQLLVDYNQALRLRLEQQLAAMQDVLARNNLGEISDFRPARIDPLTSLANRQQCIDQLTVALDGIRQASAADFSPLAVLFADLDLFKTVNDRYGHQVGDRVLCVVAERMKSLVGTNDLVARLGGDEFVVLLRGHTATEARDRADQIAASLAEPIIVLGVNHQVGVSIGISGVFTPGAVTASWNDLIHRADVAMYRAKASSTDRSVIFDVSMETAASHRSTLEQELRQAIDLSYVHVEYQPVANLTDGSVRSVEALARWTSPSRGGIRPTEFLELAESIGLSQELDRLIISRAIRDITQVLDPGSDSDSMVDLSVNLASATLNADDLDVHLLATLDALRFDPQRLILEIRERDALSISSATAARLRRLRDHGVRVSINDFGAMYRRISTQPTLGIDLLKIARNILEDATEFDREFIASMISVGHSINAEVVAQGVSSSAQFHSLLPLGLDLAQGFFLSEPVPVGRLRSSIHAARAGLSQMQLSDATHGSGSPT
jgi:diguanylate cyclase (GGDEF)-like protein